MSTYATPLSDPLASPPRPKHWFQRHWLLSLLGGVALLKMFLRFDVGPEPAGGDPYTVNVCHSSEMAPPFNCTDGPSLRHVVDLGNVDGAGGFILPTGESGNALSPHYRDQYGRWESGKLWVVPVDVRKVRAVDVLRLVP